ncbi:hypothetical protein [Dictyobacter kobayashii]|uniref:Uncharacterized protein n=1 Tax=Dictyobacter kobayashii TaxID=2014872 RepID=A0A402AYF8_9CHLR|nr:hypothetical protein [Dictyobacter kobayashii]GCE24115.1 hypothetical protein KDK_79150 [Dictyobacter kobayashii]
MRNSSASPIQENPELKRYQRSDALYSVVAVVYSLVILFYIILFFLSIQTPVKFLTTYKTGFLWLFIATQGIIVYVANKRTVFYWQWIEQRRLAAVMGGPAWNAVEQPVANALAVDLPLTVMSYTNNKQRGKFLLRTVGVILVYILIWSALSAWSVDLFLFISQNRFYIFLIFFAVLTLLMLVLISGNFHSRARPNVLVTEQGVQVGKSFVKWEEARLFAIYKGLNGLSTTYELSSATAIARWTLLTRANLIQINKRRAVPFDEYMQQMQALNALIVARTGLPLADLR